MPHAIRVEVERDIGNLFARQEAGQILAATPEAAYHRMLFSIQGTRGNGGQLQGAHQPLTGGKAQYPVSYTHLDVYKRQSENATPELGLICGAYRE